MFLLPFFLSNLMFYLDPGLEFILHVDNFLVPVASFSLLLLLQPVLSEPQHLPSPSLSGVGMCKRDPPPPNKLSQSLIPLPHPSTPASTLTLNFSSMYMHFFQVLIYLPFF